MNMLFRLFFLCLCLTTSTAQSENLIKSIGTHLQTTWSKGTPELYVSGYAWHNRFTYSKKRIHTYNEAAFGGGLGQGYIDAKNNWSSLYALTFLDSHKNVEPIAGYGFLKRFSLHEYTTLGLGYTAFLTIRPDIYHGRPFPGILPLLSFQYRKITLFATYIPGKQDIGNVLFCFVKYTF